VLKAKYDEAKAVGEAVNNSRSKISQIKTQVLTLGTAVDCGCWLLVDCRARTLARR